MHKLIFTVIKDLHNSINFLPLTNGIDAIPSYRDYLLSRMIEKFSTHALAHEREVIIDKFNVASNTTSEIIESTPFLQKCQKESRVIVATAILRGLYELLVDLDILSREQNQETASRTYIWISFIEERRRLAANMKEFYNIISPSLAEWMVDAKDFTQSLPKTILTSSFFSKIKDVIENASPSTRILLGRDYYNLYVYLSKKNHFDLRNSPADNNNKTYLDWSFAFLHLICQKFSFLVGLNNPALQEIGQILQKFDTAYSNGLKLHLSEGQIVRTDWGFGSVESFYTISPGYHKVVVKYFSSSAFGKGFIDHLPGLSVYVLDDSRLRVLLGKSETDSISLSEVETACNADPYDKNTIWWIPFHHPYRI